MTPRPTRIHPVVWVLALCVIEPIVFGVLFDAQQLNGRGVLGRALASASHVVRFALAALAVFAVTLGLRPELRAVVMRSFTGARLRPMPLVAHALSVALLYSLSRRLFDAVGVSPSPVLAASWVGCGVMAVVSLALGLMNLRGWSALLGATRSTLYLSLGAGLGGLLLGALADQLWLQLGQVTLRVVLLMLDRIESEVLVSPSAGAIGTPTFVVEISPECSGFEGMGLAVVFLAVLVLGAREQLYVARVVAFAPLLLGGVWLFNAVRIAALVWWGTHVSPEVALGAFHSKAGWILFCLIGVGTVVLLRASAWFSRDAGAAPASVRLSAATATTDSSATRVSNPAGESYNPVIVYCLPLGLQLLCGMTTGAFVHHVDWLYGVRVIAVGAGLYLTWRWLPKLAPAGWLVPTVIGGAAFGIWTWFEPAPDAARVALAQTELAGAGAVTYGAWIAARLVGSVLLVPIAEELAFRGFLLRRLIDPQFEDVAFTRWTTVSVLASSVVFGALHDNWIGGGLCGVLYAYAQVRRGAVGDAILAHAVTNLLVAVATVGFGRWALWL